VAEGCGEGGEGRARAKAASPHGQMNQKNKKEHKD